MVLISCPSIRQLADQDKQPPQQEKDVGSLWSNGNLWLVSVKQSVNMFQVENDHGYPCLTGTKLYVCTPKRWLSAQFAWYVGKANGCGFGS